MKESGRVSFGMINIGIIYLQGCSRHTGQKRLRKRDPLLKKRGGKSGRKTEVGAQGFGGGTCWVPWPPWRLRETAQRPFHCPCGEVWGAPHFPLAARGPWPALWGRTANRCGHSPLTGWDWQGGILLMTHPAILSGVERAAEIPPSRPHSLSPRPPKACRVPRSTDPSLLKAQVSLCRCSCKGWHGRQVFCHQTNIERAERKNAGKKRHHRGHIYSSEVPGEQRTMISVLLLPPRCSHGA